MPEAYDEGFRARLAGQTVHQNPYALFTQKYSDWVKGWKDQDQHLNARDEALNSIGWFA
jgi:ribosome modulation factor